jgi:hypothetical protein
LEGTKKSLLDKKEVEWRLKSKAIYLEEDDECTKFFHNYAKHIDPKIVRSQINP